MSFAPDVFSEPAVRRGPGWIAAFATAWLGIWMAQLTPVQLLLPIQIDEVLGTSDWLASVLSIGVVSAVAGVFCLIAYPLTGALSDRTVSRWGRRKPWILGGALVFAAGLVLLGLAADIVSVTIFWSLALTGFCMVSAAVTATISDQVPIGQRGLVSGWLSAPQAIGTILGLVIVTELLEGRLVQYGAIGVLLIVLIAPFLLFTEDAPLAKELRPKLGLREIIQGFWISPKRYPDFGWTLLSRVLVNLGNALGTTLLLYFIMFGLGRPDTAEDDLIVLTLIYMAFLIVASVGVGKLSDVVGRRKLFVFVSAGFQAVAAVLLTIGANIDMAFVSAGLLGIGYGTFLSVDQALATQVLPDAKTRGKDLGIMNLANAVPQAFAPLVGALVVAALGGFHGLFLAAAAVSFLGALAVLPVRSVQ